ncbi:adenine phosphoribosyltransferase 3 [Quercus suber]|uniref:adenine phosphoribosyltransferase n=1 Tax=Quercus suber TaxID=58331 RepID=A0AAW0J8F3_QUESU
MSAYRDEDPRIQGIKTKIRVVPNFPKPGIMFQDITTLLLDPKAFKDTIDLFVERYKGKNISVVAGIEARGFIFGPPIALAIGAKFVPLRKPRKLPERVGAEVVECACLIELPELQGRGRLNGKPLYVLVEYQ